MRGPGRRVEPAPQPCLAHAGVTRRAAHPSHHPGQAPTQTGGCSEDRPTRQPRPWQPHSPCRRCPGQAIRSVHFPCGTWRCVPTGEGRQQILPT